ncbi:hypothetical protein C9374_012440 [Naegleria lovaniensis]|uniref:F-box domain-containing protein n=1 Tax=Naegleria lovaniensis TaxID=51637 RepID=A0AA88GZS4_NAELO|nr:uncharacterized protein C9374_012440 [Naegleria lovaniensis]KAG2392188.1 hypothetical protein C9374_012440 [Naegleria lovaniensis]
MSRSRSKSSHVHHVENIELIDERIHTQPLIISTNHNNHDNSFSTFNISPAGQSPFRESNIHERNNTTRNRSSSITTRRNQSHHFASIISESNHTPPLSTTPPLDSSSPSSQQHYFLNSVLNLPSSTMIMTTTTTMVGTLPTNLHWENFRNLIPNDCLLNIASFLDDSFTLASLPHTCSMWFHYLNNQPLFYSQLYSIKIRELREFYLKDFDLQVQERVCRRRLKAIMALQQQQQQPQQPQQPQHPPSPIELLTSNHHNNNEIVEREFRSSLTSEHVHEDMLVMSEGEWEVLNTHSSALSENGSSTASMTSANSAFLDLNAFHMDPTNLIPPSVFRKVKLLNMENVLNHTTTSPIITSSSSSSSRRNSQYHHDETHQAFNSNSPYFWSSTKSSFPTQHVGSSSSHHHTRQAHHSFHIFEKDCYLELLRMEYLVRQHGRDILSKTKRNSHKPERPAVPLPEQLLLETLDARLRWHFFLAMPITCALWTFFVLLIAIKGILMNMGADYESEWNWCLVFVPFYLAMIMLLIYSIIDTRLSMKKYWIIHHQVKDTKRKQKARIVLKFRKHFFDNFMTSILKVIMSVLAFVLGLAWNAYLSLPHTSFGQNGWYLFIIFVSEMVLLMIYALCWFVIRQQRYGSLISLGCSLCNGISLLLLCFYVILCAALITLNMSNSPVVGMTWALAMIPIFLVEAFVLIGIALIVMVWFKLECKVARSNSQRFIYLIFHATLVVGIVLLMMHHVSMLQIQENVTFGFASLFLVPIPMIVLPLLAIIANYLVKQQQQENKYDVM